MSAFGRLFGSRPGRVDRASAAQVRRHDFSGLSDSELRVAAARLERPRLTDSQAHEVCAIVSEAIERRLGCWRLFDGGAGGGRFSRYEEIADRLLSDGPHRDQIDYYTDPGFLDSGAFASCLRASLGGYGLSDAEQTVVGAMVCVGERSGLPGPHVQLSAESYRSIREVDRDGVLAFRPTDEQIMAGLALYRGAIVEMDAGEGKTIAAAYAAALHALEGRSVHVITANDYLAERDAELLAPMYESIGLTVGAVLGYMGDAERRRAYGGQVVYGTLREFGFDFLRDNLRAAGEARVQGPLGAAVVDEADHALIDQAGTPLIISGEPLGNRRAFARTRRVIEDVVSRQRRVIEETEGRIEKEGEAVPPTALARLCLADPDSDVLRERLTASHGVRRRVGRLVDSLDLSYDDGLVGGLFFVVGRRGDSVALTEEGQGLIEARLGPLFDTSDLESRLAEARAEGAPNRVRHLRRIIDRRHSRMNQVHQMLRAYALLKRGVDYVVTDGRVVLVDGPTGRRLPDNRYQHDLHAALEAKEGVETLDSYETLARVSVPGFVGRYSELSGLTGTAVDSADEFRREYGKKVVRIPSALPSRRVDLPSRLYRTEAEKLGALVDEVALCRRVGRPALVGTVTVEQSERISRLFGERGIEHRLLNAVNSASEAEIVRSAGAPGAVTIATNMAGRGTDIVTEPGLDDRIAAGYLSVVREMLREGVDEVRLACGSSDEVDVLLGAVRTGPGGLRASRTDGGLAITRSRPFPRGTKRVSALDFGLGLYVAVTQMNQSRRADRQLRGRTARQGAFGSSRLILCMKDLRGSLPHGRGIDTGRASVVEGGRVDGMLLRSQRLIEDDDEALRAYANEYGRVMDAQAAAYYRARGEVSSSASFQDVCLGFARECADRLVRRHFPALRVTDYGDQFGRLVREAEDGYGTACADLFGVGLPALAGEVGALMLARLEFLRDAWGDRGLAEVERSLFLRTADEEWRGHLADLEGLALGIPAEPDGRDGAMSRFAARAFEWYHDFRDRTVDAFVAELLTLPLEDSPVEQPGLVEIVEEAASILAPGPGSAARRSGPRNSGRYAVRGLGDAVLLTADD